MKRVILTLTLATLVGLAGCLTHEVRHTLYLDANGGLTWSALHEEVRSDDEDPARRDAEEHEWLAGVRRNGHATARAFRAIGGRGVRSEIVRGERPYTVHTEARFVSVAEALAELLQRIGLRAEAELRYDGPRTTLTLRIGELDEEDDADEASDQGTDLEELLPGEHPYRFVLVEGSFVEARGFELQARNTAAVMLDPDDDAVPRVGEDDRLYVLTWITE
jgi:hypothetical protein